MPELPEVEVLKRHLEPLLRDQKISSVHVRRERVVAPTSTLQLKRNLQGAVFAGISRRGKYLLFDLRPSASRERIVLLGHLGMTGRMYLIPRDAALPKHAAVILELGTQK